LSERERSDVWGRLRAQKTPRAVARRWTNEACPEARTSPRRLPQDRGLGQGETVLDLPLQRVTLATVAAAYKRLPNGSGRLMRSALERYGDLVDAGCCERWSTRLLLMHSQHAAEG
jgi:hypothetical protein